MWNDPNDTIEHDAREGRAPRRTSRLRASAGIAVLAGMLVVGAAGGAFTQGNTAATSSGTTAATVEAAKINALPGEGAVTVRGKVAEIFGNKFVVDDGSGRALVETGPMGEDGNLVAKDETVTVQGMMRRGFVHAVTITHDGGKVDEVGGPPPPPRHGPKHGPKHGPRGAGPALDDAGGPPPPPCGPDDADAPPPPPPAEGAAPAGQPPAPAPAPDSTAPAPAPAN